MKPSHTEDIDPSVAVPPGPDIIDRVCDFLSFRFDQHLDRWQVITALALAIVIIIFSLAGLVRSRLASSVTVTTAARAAGKSDAAQSGTNGTNIKTAYIFVYMCGAVRQPGVYRVTTGSRVNTAISLAGGLAEGADAARINLARRVVDGERVYVPRAGEVITPALLDNTGVAPATGSTADANSSGVSASDNGSATADGLGSNSPGAGRGPAWRSDGCLNINLATAADLDLLPGIGPAFAARIIDYRQKHNSFTDVEQLGNVRGIGPKTLAKLKPLVCVE